MKNDFKFEYETPELSTYAHLQAYLVKGDSGPEDLDDQGGIGGPTDPGMFD